MTLSAYAITDVNTVKAVLNISGSGSDSLIETYINWTTDTFEKVTDKVFKARDLQQNVSPGWQNTITLDYFPVNNINFVRTGCKPAIYVSYSGTAIDYNIGWTPSGIKMSNTTSGGTTTSTFINFSSGKTFSTLATYIGGISNWYATTSGDGLATWLHPQVNTTPSGSFSINYFDNPLPYKYDGAGIIGFGSRRSDWFFDSQLNNFYPGFQTVTISYNAGYSTIPDAVQAIGTQGAVWLYKNASINAGVKSESIGEYSYTLTDAMTGGFEDYLTKIGKVWIGTSLF